MIRHPIRLTALFLVLGLQPVQASSSFLDAARFVALHPDSGPAVFEEVRRIVKGFQVIGERILLENGNLSVAVGKILSDDAKVSDLAAQTKVTLDASFFADPVKAVTEAFLTDALLTIGRAELKARLSDTRRESRQETLEETMVIDVLLRNVRIPLKNHAYDMTAKVLVFNLTSKGTTEYVPATRKLVITVGSVTMGGLPVAVDLAFLVLSKFLYYPFVTLQKPRIIVDVGSFLPTPGQGSGTGGSVTASDL